MADMKAAWIMALLLALGIVPQASAADRIKNLAANDDYKDASVHVGKDGKVVYTPDERGNLIPDFSNCGYMGGGVKIPDLPVRITLESRPGMPKELADIDPENPDAAGTGDDTARIQAAIDKVSAMPLDENGFRGAVLLKRGVYRTTKTLWIKASGVVLRGEGQAKDGTVIVHLGDMQKHIIRVYGERTIKEVPGSRREIADQYVPWGVKSFNMKSVEGFAVGDDVVVYRPSTHEWLDVMGTKKEWGQPEGTLLEKYNFAPNSQGWAFTSFHMHFERKITAIEGNRITLDAPTVHAMEDKFGGGFVYKYTEKGAVTHSGIEHLRLMGNKRDTKRPNQVLYFGGSVNCWARNITAMDRGGIGAIGLPYTKMPPVGDSKFVTTQDCVVLGNTGGGGMAFAAAQRSLIQRCIIYNGRHVNSATARVQGPNVFLDNYNPRARDAGPHHNWAMGFLYDNVTANKLIAYHGRPHPHRGAQIVFWNCKGGIKIDQPPTARNYFFGHSGLEPRSLYIKQLEERLGKEAVENVTTEAQRKAVADPASPFNRQKLLWDAMKYGIGEMTPEEGQKQ